MQHAGTGHTFIRPDLAPSDAAIEGRFLLCKLKSGIVLHATELRDLHELTTQLVTGPDLTFFVVLDGQVDFSVDQHRHIVADRRNPHSIADCGALNLTEHALMTRRSHKGDRTRKVTVSVDGEWISELVSGSAGQRLRQFTTSHLAHAAWRGSPRLLALAEQILTPPDLSPFLKDLYVESRSIEIIAEAVAALADEPLTPVAIGLATREAHKARAARDYIEANLDRTLCLSDIAREIGVSPTSLQRRFKAAYGTTVVDFVRARKLEQAREALERDGLSIGEAAFLAGYSNPANFTTAFRRAFGMLPRAVRR
jgi:AraC-like DNA-binding protein